MQDIVIKDFHTGIGESEFVGHGDIVNCDLNWRKGVARIQLESINTSAGTVTAEPVWLQLNPNNAAQMWALDTAGTIYRGTATTGSEQWSVEFDLASPASANDGLVIWKDYLLIAQAQSSGDSLLYGYGPLSSSAVLYQIASTLPADNKWHSMLVGQDDIVYIGAGRYVASLQEVTGTTFAAGTASTFTFTAQALDLPQDYRVRCISELGKNLMLGTWKGQTDIYEQKVADIFPWDRVSDSFALPIRVAENGIHTMLGADNLVYFFAGIGGKLMVTDGSNVQELARIPQHVLDLSGGAYVEILPGAMIKHDDKIVFGIHNPQSSLAQVWSYNLKTGAIIRENTSSRGPTTAISVGSLISTGRDDYWIGLTNRIDHIRSGGSAQRYSSYSAYVTSPYYKIGTKSKPAVISEIEVNLARPLVSGQGVRIAYRTNLSASFTTVDDFDFSTYGAIQERNIPFRLEIANGIQIRASLTTGSGVSTSPELTQIILR